MDSFVFDLVWVLTVVPPILLYLASRQSVYGPLKGSALHPFNVLGFLLFFISVDFFELYQRVGSGELSSFARYTISSVSEIVDGLIFLLLAGLFLAFGAYVGSRSKGRITQAIPFARPSRIVLLIAIAFTAVTTSQIVLQSISYGSIFYLAGVRQTFFSDNVILQVFFATLAPSFILYAANNHKNTSSLVFFFLICFLLILPIGSRGALLYLIIVGLVIMAMRGFRFPVYLAYVVSPVLLVFSTYLRFLREHSGADTFQRYLEIRGAGAFLGGEDFNLSEAIIVGMRPDILPRYPFETFLGMIVAIIPRSIVPWKPEGPSSVFSALADPERWRLTGSEWLITGLINLRVELGYIGAMVAMALIAYFWSRSVTRGFRQGTSSAIAVSTFAIIFAYIFIRGDLYNASLFAWPVLIVWTMNRLLVHFSPERRADLSHPSVRGV